MIGSATKPRTGKSAGPPQAATPAWIAGLTSDERNAIGNGTLLSARHHVGTLIGRYRSVIEHQEKQPPSPTRDMLLAGLTAQVELLEDELEQIEQRQREWHAYFRRCMDGDENWRTGLPWRAA